jgi:hypothetical protein
MNHASQSKASAETWPPIKDQTANPPLGRPGAAKVSRKNSRGKSGTPAGNVTLSGNGKTEDALPGASELSEQVAEIAQKRRKLAAEFLKRQAAGERVGMANPLAIGTAFREMTARLMSHRSRLVQAQLSLWNGLRQLVGSDYRMQATGSGHWGLLPTHTADFGPDVESLGPGSSMLGGSDVIAAEVEEVIDLVVG